MVILLKLPEPPCSSQLSKKDEAIDFQDEAVLSAAAAESEAKAASNLATWQSPESFKGCARCGQREFVHRAVVPPILAPKSPHPWASLGAPSPTDAHDARACGAHQHHEVTAAGGSSIIEFAGAAPPKNLPQRHTERARAFR